MFVLGRLTRFFAFSKELFFCKQFFLIENERGGGHARNVVMSQCEWDPSLDGKTLAAGEPENVLTADNLEKAYGIRIREENNSMAEAFAMTWELGDSRPPDGES